jgi:hypothetical protein
MKYWHNVAEKLHFQTFAINVARTELLPIVDGTPVIFQADQKQVADHGDTGLQTQKKS